MEHTFLVLPSDVAPECEWPRSAISRAWAPRAVGGLPGTGPPPPGGRGRRRGLVWTVWARPATPNESLFYFPHYPTPTVPCPCCGRRRPAGGRRVDTRTFRRGLSRAALGLGPHPSAQFRRPRPPTRPPPAPREEGRLRPASPRAPTTSASD